MAISSFRSYLMYCATKTGTYTKLCDTKTGPDLGSAPEPIEVTTQSDPARVYIPGIENTDQQSYTANYTLADYQTIKGLKGTEYYISRWLGASYAGGIYTPSGSDGKFTGKGYIDVYVNGNGVNDPDEMTIVITLTEPMVEESTVST